MRESVSFDQKRDSSSVILTLSETVKFRGECAGGRGRNAEETERESREKIAKKIGGFRIGYHQRLRRARAR